MAFNEGCSFFYMLEEADPAKHDSPSPVPASEHSSTIASVQYFDYRACLQLRLKAIIDLFESVQTAMDGQNHSGAILTSQLFLLTRMQVYEGLLQVSLRRQLVLNC